MGPSEYCVTRFAKLFTMHNKSVFYLFTLGAPKVADEDAAAFVR